MLHAGKCYTVPFNQRATWAQVSHPRTLLARVNALQMQYKDRFVLTNYHQFKNNLAKHGRTHRSLQRYLQSKRLTKTQIQILMDAMYRALLYQSGSVILQII